MSRTDVHAPSWVKERDPAWRANYTEVHNHHQHIVGHEKHTDAEGHTSYRAIYQRVEECQLPVFLAAHKWVRTSCYISYVHTGRNIHCGCHLCTGHQGRRLANRVDRQRARRLLREGRFDEVVAPRRQRY